MQQQQQQHSEPLVMRLPTMSLRYTTLLLLLYHLRSLLLLLLLLLSLLSLCRLSRVWGPLPSSALLHLPRLLLLLLRWLLHLQLWQKSSKAASSISTEKYAPSMT